MMPTSPSERTLRGRPLGCEPSRGRDLDRPDRPAALELERDAMPAIARQPPTRFPVAE